MGYVSISHHSQSPADLLAMLPVRFPGVAHLPNPAEESQTLVDVFSPLFLTWAGITVLLAASLGFVAGHAFARLSDRRAYRRARSGLAQIFQTVITTMESARDVCLYLQRFPGVALTEKQLELFERSRQRLQDVVTNIVEQHRRLPEPLSLPNDPGLAGHSEPIQVKWVFSTEDQTTGLPDRPAFDTNLEMVLDVCRRTEQPSGLVLVKVDKFDALKQRHGLVDSKRLLKKFGLVLCRAIRNTDLICRYSPDTFGILLPATDPWMGEKLAATLRDAIRGYHFRSDEGGPEVLVTASLGYTLCRGEDTADVVVNRAADALSRSQRVGRNQLHMHDGTALTHCVAG